MPLLWRMAVVMLEGDSNRRAENGENAAVNVR